VRRKTVVLPEPPGPRKGTSGVGEKLRLLILGDSAAAGVGADHQDLALLGQLVRKLSESFCVSWQLEATTGATTAQSNERIDELNNCQFDVVLTSLGVNDITSNVSLSEWKHIQNDLHKKCLKIFGADLVIVTAVPPMGQFLALPQPLRWYLGNRSNQFNDVLEKQIFAKSKIRFMSIEIIEDITAMASDGFHPGEKVYELWAIHAAKEITSFYQNNNIQKST